MRSTPRTHIHRVRKFQLEITNFREHRNWVHDWVRDRGVVRWVVSLWIYRRYYSMKLRVRDQLFIRNGHELPLLIGAGLVLAYILLQDRWEQLPAIRGPLLLIAGTLAALWAQSVLSASGNSRRIRRSLGSGKSLEGADLASAYLRDAYLRGRVLRGAKLSNSDLRDADLRGSDLFDARLTEAHLQGADFTGADLRKAGLYKAQLQRSVLVGADLSRAKATAANFCRSNLEGANLSGADLDRADFTGASVKGAVFTQANLEGVYYDQGSIDPQQLESANTPAEATDNVSHGFAGSVGLRAITTGSTRGRTGSEAKRTLSRLLVVTGTVVGALVFSATAQAQDDVLVDASKSSSGLPIKVTIRSSTAAEAMVLTTNEDKSKPVNLPYSGTFTMDSAGEFVVSVEVADGHEVSCVLQASGATDDLDEGQSRARCVSLFLD